tara:strand:- start:31 stop:135 length:105 start_codon:yes stop_codon:yes gene_type:complete
MMPWERKIYLKLLNAYIKEENIKLHEETLKRKLK